MTLCVVSAASRFVHHRAIDQRAIKIEDEEPNGTRFTHLRCAFSRMTRALLGGGTTIPRMIDTVENRHRLKLERIRNSRETADIDAVLVGVGASLMMGVDAADRTEIVLRRLGIELVQAQ